MGFLRKATFVVTGGGSGLFIRANSKKERMAKAAEKQLALQRKTASHAQRQMPVGPRSISHPVVGVADELAKLARLREQGVLTEAEFEAQKARLLG